MLVGDRDGGCRKAKWKIMILYMIKEKREIERDERETWGLDYFSSKGITFWMRYWKSKWEENESS